MFNRFDDVFILDGVRTPQVDYQGAFADANPIDLGIKAARAVLVRAGIDAAQVDSVVTGNMAPGGFDQFYVARHIGLYAGVPQEVPALNAQRICGTGFEVFRQAGEQIMLGCAALALVVGTESMTRNPIAAFDHRGGFRLGAPIGFKDYMWEALTDPAAVSMIQTAENLARQYGITRAEVDAFAAGSFAKAVAAQAAGWFDGEIVPVASERFELPGYKPRGQLRLAGKADRGRPRHPPAAHAARGAGQAAHGVQGRRADRRQQLGADRRRRRRAGGQRRRLQGLGPPTAGPPGRRGRGGRAARDHGHRPGTGHPAAAGAQRPEARRHRRFEINEAQGAQTLAVGRELGLDLDRLNVKGGAIALGHPLAATGVRLTITVARQLKEIGARWGVAFGLHRRRPGHRAADRKP
jgi:acetyl-CoA C-acetyltransferase